MLVILIGAFWLGPWTIGAVNISDAERAMALQNHIYLYFRKMGNYFGSIQVLLLFLVLFISVFKPWGQRNKKKTP